MKKIYLSIFFLFFLSTQIGQAQIKRVRVNFNSPLNLNRELLLGFTPNGEATDGFDYGYDGGVPDTWPDDLNWIIEENRYVIQGVGEYHESKTYPFWLNLSNTGNSTISLISTENFTESVTVYIYDSLDNTYHNISEQPLTLNLTPSEYENRFFIAFQLPAEPEGTLSLSDENSIPELEFYQSGQENKIIISPKGGTEINSVSVYNSIGQKILSKALNSYSDVKLHLPYLQSQVLLIEIKTNKGRIIKRILI